MPKNFVSFGDAETLVSEVADKIEHLTYVGTKAAWESMSVAERQKYRAFDFTDYDADTDTENRLTALEEKTKITQVTVNTSNPYSFTLPRYSTWLLAAQVSGVGQVAVIIAENGGNIIFRDLLSDGNNEVLSAVGDTFTFKNAGTAQANTLTSVTAISTEYGVNAVLQFKGTTSNSSTLKFRQLY